MYIKEINYKSRLMYRISLWCTKKKYFTRLIYERKISRLVPWYKTSIIQQYDTWNLKIHAGQGLEIGPETIDANKGIKPSRRRTSWGEIHSLVGLIFLLLGHLDRNNLLLLLHQWYMASTISYRTFGVSQVPPIVCPNAILCHLLERIQAENIYQRFSWIFLNLWYFGQGNLFYSHLTLSTGYSVLNGILIGAKGLEKLIYWKL